VRPLKKRVGNDYDYDYDKTSAHLTAAQSYYKETVPMRFIFSFLALFVWSAPVFAYIDPGSGSAIVSAIIGFFVATGMLVKTYWYKLKSLFFGGSNAPNESDVDGSKDSSGN
jgi:hypothetical protein